MARRTRLRLFLLIPSAHAVLYQVAHLVTRQVSPGRCALLGPKKPNSSIRHGLLRHPFKGPRLSPLRIGPAWLLELLTGRRLLADALHQLPQSLDARLPIQDQCGVILAVRILLGVEHKLKRFGTLV